MFLFFEPAVFPKKIKALFPQEERYEQLQKILTDINEAIRAYLSVKLTVSLITAISSYAVMAIMGLDFTFFWAFLIFLLNFIPNIGSLIATIFPADSRRETLQCRKGSLATTFDKLRTPIESTQLLREPEVCEVTCAYAFSVS